MDVVSTAQSGAAQGQTQSNAASAKSVLSSDFETFLKMLTAQVQNQDPLNPVDSTEYATQLATFSSVEQQVQTNQLLENMVGMLGGNAIQQMSHWIGMEGLVPAPAYFDGSPVTMRPQINEDAASARLMVWDSEGTLVQQAEVPVDSDSFVWSGLDSEGNPLPEGRYTFSLRSLDADGNQLDATAVPLYSRIAEVRSDNGDLLVRLADGSELPSTMITALRRSED